MANITINIKLDGCEKEISIIEASELYDALGIIFNNGESINTGSAVNVYPYADEELQVSGYDYFEGKDNVKYHPDVEQAKRKAQEASKCCGSK